MRSILGRLPLGGVAPNAFLLQLKGEQAYSDSDLTVVCQGYVKPFEQDLTKPQRRLSVCEIKDLYLRHGLALTEHVDGLFALVVYEKSKRVLHILQAQYFYPLDIYYTTVEGRFVFSTSLKRLLAAAGNRPRVFNDEALQRFLYNGIVASRSTLVEGVFKLTAGDCLTVDARTGAQRVERIRRPARRLDETQARSCYREALKTSLASRLTYLDGIAMCLSSGYDSNHILNALCELTQQPVNACSVGGVNGIDESMMASRICTCYPNAVFRRAIVLADSLQSYPDIVWRLDGSVYERGIFLQYELAKLVHELGFKSMICGECADQVLHRKFDPEPKRLPKRLSLYLQPYEMCSFFVIKKNGIMLNSFGIQGEYPFGDTGFVDLGRALKRLNGETKEFHKQVLKRHAPEAALEVIAKRGGGTDFMALFRDDDEFTELTAKIARTPVYERVARRLHKYYRRSAEEPGEHEKEVQMKLLYVHLFERLFLSGAYDDCMDRPAMEVTLNDVIRDAA